MSGPLIRLVVSGATGRMGRTVGLLAAEDRAFELIGGIDREGAPPGDGPAGRITELADAAELIRAADVLIDFSAPAFLGELLTRHGGALAKTAIVVGTTGLRTEEESLLMEASRRSAVVTAANFSLGVALVADLVERAAAVLGDGFDVEIVEAHHRRKEDAPSGTALLLGQSVAKGRGADLSSVRRDGRSGRPGARPEGEIGFHALRGGDIVGDHHVHFIGDHERIEITHRASDRSLFAAGALRAARWAAGQDPGRYTVKDVLGL